MNLMQCAHFVYMEGIRIMLYTDLHAENGHWVYDILKNGKSIRCVRCVRCVF